MDDVVVPLINEATIEELIAEIRRRSPSFVLGVETHEKYCASIGAGYFATRAMIDALDQLNENRLTKP